ncbi:Maf-like protein-domain-containing protein [Biscogniauxia mediterranea]|nr:Maf-like protein-domain-containing protein [Biscogniauxia mediterranea]
MDQKQPLLSSTDEMPSDPPPDYSVSVGEHKRSGSSATTLSMRQRDPAGATPAPNRRSMPPPPPMDLPILRFMRTHRVILASSSPRRRALLAQVGLPNIEILPSTKPENLSKKELGAYEYVTATAQQKALDVYRGAVEAEGGGEGGKEEANDNDDGNNEQRTGKPKNAAAAAGEKKGDPDLVISADTVIVTRDGTILEKPASEAGHKRMLRVLRDTRVHRVLTAVCAVAPKADASYPGYAMRTHVEETKVYFAREADGLPDDVIDSYVRTREGVDKAGGYAVQGIGGMVLVDRVEGAVDNVVGLPVRKCLQLCEKVVFRQDEESEGEEGDEFDI